MEQQKNTHLVQAAEYWAKGQPLKAGEVIYENLPLQFRPKWASRILKIVLNRGGVQSSLFDQVLIAADDEFLYKSGHRVFSAIRESTLKLDELRRDHDLSEDQKLLASVLSLAELVAKVIYNATNPPDEFDEDSGWWIAAHLRAFVDHRWKDVEFAREAWSALSSYE
jgi:hypothetical protein